MIPLTPSFLVATAGAFIGLGEEGGDNRGQMVELCLREVNQPPGQPWCAAFVYHVGFWSHFDHRAGFSSWPLPATASCWELGEFARQRGVLATEPVPGDVFLLWSKARERFAHTGIVVDVGSPISMVPRPRVVPCTTIEGNTNEDGAPEGRWVLRKERRFSAAEGDRFIRWIELAARRRAAA